MTDHAFRLYAGATALLAFFLVWAVVAARPWADTGQADPRMVALERREQSIARDAQRVNRVVERRFATYRRRLARREREIAAARAAAPAGAPAPPPPFRRRGAQRAAPGGRQRRAARHRHGELVMERLGFKAMGTSVEVLMEAAPSAAVLGGWPAYAPSSSGWSSLLALPGRLGALPPQRIGDDRGQRRHARGRAARAGRARPDGGTLRPALHDALVAAGYDSSFDELGESGPADAVAPAVAGGDVAVRGRRIELGAACASTSAASSRASRRTAARAGSRASGRAL